MRIAVVTACTSTLPNYRLDMIKEFVARGHSVVVCGDEPEKDWKSFFGDLSVEYRSYFVSRNGLNPLHDIKTKNELRQLFVREAVDAVWTYQAKPNIYGCLAAHDAGVQRIYAMMGGLGSVFRAEDAKSRFVRKIVTSEYRQAFKNVSGVFFQNEEDRGLFESLGIIDREKTVLTRGSGVNLDFFKQTPLPDNVSFVFVGRLVKGKGVFEYLEAAKLVKETIPDASFHLVGPFDSNPTSLTKGQLDPYIDDGVIEYHGEQADVRPFLEASSCFVLPSYYGEGTPKSALEAMAIGRPLIVADAVGCREVVQVGTNGYLVEPKSVSSLAEAMIKVACDTTQRQEMAENSRKMAEQIFDVVKVNDTICAAMGL